MKRFALFLSVFCVFASCNEPKIDSPSKVEPSNLEEAAALMSADQDYQAYVETEKKLKYLLAMQRVDMPKVGERMNEPGKGDLCLWTEDQVSDIKGGYEYAQLLCMKINLIKVVYEKFPFLKDLSTKDQQYLLSRDTKISISPEEVLSSMK
tara:strand:- start:102 stop:554 length:453 start_codon:yes stop_codon:yes gene_type:complete